MNELNPWKQIHDVPKSLGAGTNFKECDQETIYSFGPISKNIP